MAHPIKMLFLNNNYFVSMIVDTVDLLEKFLCYNPVSDKQISRIFVSHLLLHTLQDLSALTDLTEEILNTCLVIQDHSYRPVTMQSNIYFLEMVKGSNIMLQGLNS